MSKLLVGNKSDLVYQRAVEYTVGKEFADSLGIKFLETSAKNSSNVDEAFHTMTTEINSRVFSGLKDDKEKLILKQPKEFKKGCGC